MIRQPGHRWALAAIVGGLMLMAGTATQAYVGRVQLRDSTVQGCLRRTLDRAVNARGWRTAETARRMAYARDANQSDLRAANVYALIAASLEARTRPTIHGRETFCARAYPHPSIVPWAS